MSSYQFTNNASTTLGSSVSSSDTTITVATGTGNSFPAISGSQFFTATLWANGSTTGLPNGVVKVTARSGDTMTVVRGQEGTTAQSWNVGDTFANYPTAGFLNSVADGGAIQAQIGNYAADTGTANAGVVSLSPVPANLAALVGVPIRVKKQGAASTGVYTLNVNSLGATTVNVGGQAMVGGELAGNDVYTVVYNGTTFDLQTGVATVNTQQIAAQAVTNAKLALMPAGTVKANLSGGSAPPSDATLAALLAALGLGSATLATNGSAGIPVHVGSAVVELIINWGVYSFTTEANWTVTFGAPYPNACLWFNPGLTQTGGPGNQNNVSVEDLTLTNTTATAYCGAGGNSDPITLHWLAIGY